MTTKKVFTIITTNNINAKTSQAYAVASFINDIGAQIAREAGKLDGFGPDMTVIVEIL